MSNKLFSSIDSLFDDAPSLSEREFVRQGVEGTVSPEKRYRGEDITLDQAKAQLDNEKYGEIDALFADDFNQPDPYAAGRNDSFLGDTVDLLQHGAAQGLGGALDFVGADTAAQSLYGIADDQLKTLTPETLNALQAELFDSEGEYFLGKDIGNPRAWAAKTLDTLGLMATPIPGGALVSGVARTAMGLTKLSKALAKAKNIPLSEAKKIVSKNHKFRDWAATTIGYGGAEGATSAGLTEKTVRERLENMDLSQSEEYQQALAGTGDPEAARQQVIGSLSKEAAWKTFGPTALLGAGAGRFYDDALRGMGSGSRSLNALKGGATEAMEEMPQGAAETFAQNTTLQKIDPTIDTTDGMIENMLEGGALGFGTGAAIGGVLPKGDTRQQIIDQAGEDARARGGDDLDAELAKAHKAVETQNTSFGDIDAAHVDLPDFMPGPGVMPEMTGTPNFALDQMEGNRDRQGLLVPNRPVTPEGSIEYEAVSPQDLYQPATNPLESDLGLSGGPIIAPSNELSSIPYEPVAPESSLDLAAPAESFGNEIDYRPDSAVDQKAEAFEDKYLNPKEPEPLAPIENRYKKPNVNSKTIDPDVDDIMLAIVKSGGLNFGDMAESGLDPAYRNKRIGIRAVFTENGKTLDEMAEHLSQFRYLSDDYTANELLDKVMRSLGGEEIYTPSGYNNLAERQAMEAEEVQQARFDEAQAAAEELRLEPMEVDVPESIGKPEVSVATMIGTAIGSGVSGDVVNNIVEATSSAEDTVAQLREAIKEAEHDRLRQEGSNEGRISNSAATEREEEIPGWDETEGETHTDEELDALFGPQDNFSLSTQTEQELADQPSQEDIEAQDQKDQVDREQEHFGLDSGDGNASNVGMGGNQSGLFTPTGEATQAAKSNAEEKLASDLTERLRQNTENTQANYNGKSLKELASHVLNHAIERGRRMTQQEIDTAAERYGVPANIVKQFTTSPNSYDGILALAEQGDKAAKALKERWFKQGKTNKLPDGFELWQAEKGLAKGKWGVVKKGTVHPEWNWHKTPEEATKAFTSRQQQIQKEEAALKEQSEKEQELANRLRNGGSVTDKDLKLLGLKQKSRFDYLSPVVQRLFGINRMKVRKAMGDALYQVTSDMGNKATWGDSKQALSNAAKTTGQAAQSNNEEVEQVEVEAAKEDKTTKESLADTSEVGGEMLFNRRQKGFTFDDVKNADNDTERVAMAVKGKLWTRPDYQELVDSGVTPAIAHIVKQIYDSIAAKPKHSSDKYLYAYVEGVEATREAVDTFLQDNTLQVDMTLAVANQMKTRARSFSEPVDMMEMLDSGKKGKASLNWFFDRIFPKVDGYRWGKNNEAGNDRAIAMGNKFDKALQLGQKEFIKAIKAVKEGFPAKQEAWQRSYSITEKDEKFVLRQKNRYRDLGVFDTKEQAVEAARDLAKQQREEQFKEPDTSPEKSVRKGADRRNGRSVSTQEFQETFGLSKVNFGNWLKADSKAKERQAHINSAYDALLDLSDVLGVPPKAMSLNGALSIAIGAQGKGKYAAHFVPGFNEINITRRTGAGSLAHEWGHALDHYFGVQAGMAKKDDPFLSEAYHVDKKNEIRPEIVNAFDSIVKAMTRYEKTKTAEEMEADRAAMVERSRKYLDSWLEKVIASASKDKTEQELSKFNAIIERLRAGDVGESVRIGKSRSWGNTATNELREAYKDLTGHYFSLDQAQSIASYSSSLSTYMDMDKFAETHEPQVTVRTQYAKNASGLEAKSAKKRYWSSSLEMFARAFEMYVVDKLAESSGRNDYLTSAWKTDPKSPFAEEAAKRYPQGDERVRINAAFDVLVGEIKTKETDSGVALYSRQAPRKSGNSVSRVKQWLAKPLSKLGNWVDVEVVQSVSDIPGNHPVDVRGVYLSPAAHNAATYQNSVERSPRNTSVSQNVFDRNAVKITLDDLILIKGKLESSAAINMETPNREGVSDGRTRNVKSLSDVAHTDAFQVHGMRGFSVPTQRVVVGYVRTMLQDPKIRDVVIQLIPVDVMNALSGRELTPKMLLNDVSMLGNRAFVDSNPLVAAAIDIADAAMGVLALPRAVFGPATGNNAFGFSEILSAMKASTFNPKKLLATLDRAEVMAAINRRRRPMQALRTVVANNRRHVSPQNIDSVETIVTEGANKIYIVADNITKADAKEVLAHEVVGHLGIETLLGKKAFDQVLRQVQNLKRIKNKRVLSIVAELKRNYVDKDGNYTLDEMQESREILAHLAESNPSFSVIRKIKARIKLWLARHGFGSFDDAMLESLIVAAARHTQTNYSGFLEQDGQMVPAYMVAYHGTPHSFDKFSLEAIGTGEGAQAYGWGMYFAGRKGVAEYYRDQLSQEVPLINGKPTSEHKIFDANDWATPHWKNLWAAYIQDGDIDAAKADVVADLKYRLRREDGDSDKQQIQETIEFIRSIESIEYRRDGNLYQVDIPEDSELLDWDKPMSESEMLRVYDAMQQESSLANFAMDFQDRWYKIDESGRDNWDGQDLYMELSKELGSDRSASQYLNSIGIPGLRYLDGSSRHDEDGSHNYVIWDENVVTIESVNDELRQAAYSRDNNPDQSDKIGSFSPKESNEVMGDNDPESTAWKRAEAKGLDMSKEARMQRARDMGFDTDTVWYHTSNKDFSQFNADNVGTWFSDNSVESEVAADVDGPVRQIPSYVRGRFFEYNGDEPSEALTQKLSGQGYKGIIMPSIGGASRDLVVFSPADIRSVNAAFDPDESDSSNIMYSRKVGEDRKPIMSGLRDRLDAVRYQMQDKLIDLKRQQEGVEVEDDANPYQKASVWEGRAGERINDFDEDHVQPLLEKVAEADLTLEQVGEWLVARHAEEANEYLAEINPDKPDSERYRLSGMSNEEAGRILKEHKDNAALQEAGKMVDQINSDRVDMLVNEGLITSKVAANWRGRYKHYVPLKREEAMGNDYLPSRGQGFNIKGRESKQRTGSAYWTPSKILANTLAQTESSIVRAEKTHVGQALLKFVEENPDPDFWAIDTDRKTKTVRDGKVIEGVKLWDAPNELTVKRDGEEYVIVFNPENKRAMRLVSGMKNLQAAQMGTVMQGIAHVTRFLSNINTSYNPEFMISNFFRDIQTAAYNLSDTEISNMKARVIKDVPGAMNGIRSALFGDGSAEWAETWEDFRKHGGKTGWIDLHKDLEVKERNLKKAVERLKEGKHSKTGFTRFVKAVEDMNIVVENGVRLSAYKNAIDAGLSKDKAASLAKDLTVNFNRKGAQGQTINALYMFYNAAVQGNVRLLQAMAKSKKGRRLAYATIGFAVVLDMINRSLSGDDDDGENMYDALPDYVKNHYIIVMGEKEPIIKIPAPWGYNVLHAIGQSIGEAATKERFDPLESAARVGMSFIDAFNPVGSGTIAQVLSPTITDPIVQIAENKNFAGNPLKPEHTYDSRMPKPEYQMHFSTAREASKNITKWLNDVSGGNEISPGSINISPEWIDMLVDHVTGGMGRTVANTQDTVTRLITGKELPTKNIPFVRKVTGFKNDYALKSRYYEWSLDVAYTKSELKNLKGVDRLKASKKPERQLIGIHTATEKRLRVLRKQRRNLKKRGADEVRIEQIDAQIRKVMARFNKRYIEVMFQ